VSFFRWGDEEKAGVDEPRVQRLRVDSLSFGHTPDKHRKPAKGHESDPVQIRVGLFGGYRVVDGVARLYAAQQRGDKYIYGQVWD
jgi:hypothetical protein